MAHELKFDFAIGDSIGVGLNMAMANHLIVDPKTAELFGRVVAKQGISPKAVMDNIHNLLTAKPAAVQDKNIALSGGVSNAPLQIALISQQIATLVRNGGHVVLIGVSTTFGFPHPIGDALNKRLATIASAAGIEFSGGFQSGSDHVHPKNFNTVLHQATTALNEHPALLAHNVA